MINDFGAIFENLSRYKQTVILQIFY